MTCIWARKWNFPAYHWIQYWSFIPQRGPYQSVLYLHHTTWVLNAYCKRGYFHWVKISQKFRQNLSHVGNFHDISPISFRKSCGFFPVGEILRRRSYHENYPHIKISTLTVHACTLLSHTLHPAILKTQSQIQLAVHCFLSAVHRLYNDFSQSHTGLIHLLPVFDLDRFISVKRDLLYNPSQGVSWDWDVPRLGCRWLRMRWIDRG